MLCCTMIGVLQFHLIKIIKDTCLLFYLFFIIIILSFASTVIKHTLSR